MHIFSPRYWFWPETSHEFSSRVASSLDAGNKPKIIDSEGTIQLDDMLIMRTSGFSEAYFLVATVKIEDELMIIVEAPSLQWLSRKVAFRLRKEIDG